MSGDRRIIAIDGGGSHTRAGLYDGAGALIAEAEGGPSNPFEDSVPGSVAALIEVCRKLTADVSSVEIVAGVAGTRQPEIASAIAAGLRASLPVTRITFTNDISALLFANAKGAPAVMAIAGTGSSVMVHDEHGDATLFGGQGALMGDGGSGFAIALQALRAVAAMADGVGRETELMGALCDAVGVADYGDLVAWSSTATKREVATLTPVVDRIAEGGDRLARHCVLDQASALAELILSAYNRFLLPEGTPLFMNGSVVEHCGLYRGALHRHLADAALDIKPNIAPVRGHRAVVQLALDDAAPPQFVLYQVDCAEDPEQRLTERKGAGPPLDRLGAEGIVQRMHEADLEAVQAAGQCRAAIARTVEAAAESLRVGGRLVYIGAGTSGRIGVLDASECPPTFGVPPGVVIGIMAGGDSALRTGIEGAEDDRERAVRDLDAQVPDLGDRDTMVGIAASGSTPYTRAALDHARACGATTVLLSCNPVTPDAADIVIEALTGPEALPGSTRLKAGTATKVILNAISTGAMALSGRVYDGYMVCVQPTNDKLRARAVRIVAAITGAPPEVCEARLRETDWHVPTAVVMARKGLDAQAAAALLAKHNDNLRQALDEA